MPTTSLEVYTPEKQKEVLQLLGISGPANQIQLLFSLAERYDLDVLGKEISLIPGKGPFIGVWGRLHIAHRSGKLDGLEMDDEWETEKHYCVRVIVWRKDMRHPAAKVIGRVGKHEGSKDKAGKWQPKEWPLEIARARGLRAGLGFAFSIHDTYDNQDDDSDGWAPPPDERVPAGVDTTTGEVIDINNGRVNRPEPTSPREASAEADRNATTPTRGTDNTSKGPDPATELEPFDGPEPPTVVVGGHTLAQRIAMVARDAGIEDDDTRHDIIRAATKGAYTRGRDIPDTDQAAIDRVFDAFNGLASRPPTVELRYDPDKTPRLYRIRRP